jgi:[acyl-carrier-protein] S-malonyltransferase
MRRVGCLFSGQGAQYVGMGRDLVEEFPAAAEVFRRADEILGFPLSSVCFDGPEEKLTATQYSQPAILTVSTAAVAAAWPGGGPDGEDVVAAAGLSLGEYSALVFAGALSFEDGLRLVARRGELMAEAGRERQGAMLSVIGLDDEKVEELCHQASTEAELAVAANFNCPGQVVVSGDPPAVARAAELARAAEARGVRELDVSGAFHSPLMEPAREGLARHLEDVPFTAPRVPVISNVTGEPVTDPEEIRQNLAEQLTHPVRWSRCCRRMLELNAEALYEIGPGKVLRGLMRRIDRGVPVTLLGTSADVKHLGADD